MHPESSEKLLSPRNDDGPHDTTTQYHAVDNNSDLVSGSESPAIQVAWNRDSLAPGSASVELASLASPQLQEPWQVPLPPDNDVSLDEVTGDRGIETVSSSNASISDAAESVPPPARHPDELTRRPVRRKRGRGGKGQKGEPEDDITNESDAPLPSPVHDSEATVVSPTSCQSALDLDISTPLPGEEEHDVPCETAINTSSHNGSEASRRTDVAQDDYNDGEPSILLVASAHLD
jgi:hypothetical protein